MPHHQFIEANPRTKNELETLPNVPQVLDYAEEAGINEVVHFTTQKGLVGILACKYLKCCNLLSKEQYLEHIYRPNVSDRKDSEWTDYVHLSIERINNKMFDFSNQQHLEDDNCWVVLSFHPHILADPGVIFTTTNNIYTGCRRSEGLAGLKTMYANRICRWTSECINRNSESLPAWPTDRQAEVLYPVELSTGSLQKVSVQTEEAVVDVYGLLGAIDLSIEVCLAPEKFL